MNFVDLHAFLREGKGKENSKRIRDKGSVPCVLYKKGEESISLEMDNKVLSKALHTQAGENVIIRLIVDGLKKDKERTVIVKEVQTHPIKDIILHADFQEISLTETLTVTVKITAKGEAIGVKQDEGILEQIMWETEVECLPTNIPEKIDVDVSSLKMGEAIHVKDIQPQEGVKILSEPENVVFMVEHIKEEAEEPAAAEEGTAQEPEMIREKKEKPEEEEKAG